MRFRIVYYKIMKQISEMELKTVGGVFKYMSRSL